VQRFLVKYRYQKRSGRNITGYSVNQNFGELGVNGHKFQNRCEMSKRTKFSSKKRLSLPPLHYSKWFLGEALLFVYKK
jgi:hypothetical protein